MRAADVLRTLRHRAAVCACFICFASFVCVLCTELSSCFARQKEIEFELDESDPLALAPDVQWIVVREPYVALRSAPGWSSPIASHCRRGQVLQIIGNETLVQESEPRTEKWYFVPGGWLPGSAVTICANKFLAESVSEKM